MKRSHYVSFVIFFIIFSTFIFQSPQAKENSLKKGKWALQFEIDRDFDLSGFQGQTLSVKKHTADNRAYRMGLTVALDVGDGEIVRRENGSIVIPGDRDISSSRLDFNLQKIFYVDPAARVNMFFGIGPSFSFSHFGDKRDIRNSSNTEIDFREIRNNSVSLGLSGILGVEWFITRDLSLLGEYATSLSYRSTCSRDEILIVQSGAPYYSRFNREQTNEFVITSSNVKFGLSVYF